MTIREEEGDGTAARDHLESPADRLNMTLALTPPKSSIPAWRLTRAACGAMTFLQLGGTYQVAAPSATEM